MDLFDEKQHFLSSDKKPRTATNFSNFSNNFTENYPHSFALSPNREISNNFGIKELLLVKCKNTIEELHIEIEEISKAKNIIEENSQKLKEENAELQNELEEITEKNKNLEDEISQNKSKFNETFDENRQLKEKIEFLNRKIEESEEYKEKFNKMCEINTNFKEEIQNLNQELDKKDKLAREWQETLDIINSKLSILASENTELKREKTNLVDMNSRMSPRQMTSSPTEDYYFSHHKDVNKNLENELSAAKLSNTKLIEVLKFKLKITRKKKKLKKK